MSGTYEKSKSEMDELQFNASLDALLDGDTLSDGSPSGSGAYAQVPGSITMPANTMMQSAEPSQGLLMTSGTVGSLGESRAASLGLQISGVNYGGVLPSNTRVTYPGLPSFGTFGQQALLPASAVTADPVKSADTATVVSSATSKKSKSLTSRVGKRGRDISAVSEDEEERDRRRQDRNLREQQRSQKITLQIEHLRDVLAAANVQFKPDKYSTLVSVADYIKQLQERSAVLDVEHKKLLDTISKTNEIVNEQYLPASATGAKPPGSENLEGKHQGEDAVFVPSIDYRNVFARCGVPLAVLSIDGRFLACNQGFENLTGYSRHELLPCENSPQQENNAGSSSIAAIEDTNANRNLSLFNLLTRENMEGVFLAMSNMLKSIPKQDEESEVQPKSKDHWSGVVSLSRNPELSLLMNVSLVRSSQGRAKFFDCSLTSVAAEASKPVT